MARFLGTRICVDLAAAYGRFALVVLLFPDIGGDKKTRNGQLPVCAFGGASLSTGFTGSRMSAACCKQSSSLTFSACGIPHIVPTARPWWIFLNCFAVARPVVHR